MGTDLGFEPIVAWLVEHEIGRVAVVGSRKYPSLTHVDRFIVALPREMTIVTGGAKGVDQRAEEMARERGMTLEVYLPEYDSFPAGQKHRAPLARNQRIVDACEALVAFHDGKSTGTMHVVNLAKKAKKFVAVIAPQEKGDAG